MKQLLLQYTVVGGMPDVVQTFLNTGHLNEVIKVQRDILRSYEDDMIKYADRKDKALIRDCFLSIPNQLSKKKQIIPVQSDKKGIYGFKICRKHQMDRGCRNYNALL